MVTGEHMGEVVAAACAADAGPGTGDLAIWIDGTQPLSAASVEVLAAVCDRAEDSAEHSRVIVHVSGAPDRSWADGLTVTLVSKWERGLRRFERLAGTTIAVAVGDCGGLALDALLVTDYRIATASVRLLVPVEAGATWPGLALYRLARQAGAAAVRRSAMFGSPIDAGSALALHLIDELTDDTASALAKALRLADTFSGAELAIRRQLLLDAPGIDFDDALGVHLAACDRMLRQRSARNLR
jgi:isomerase DpgB